MRARWQAEARQRHLARRRLLVDHHVRGLDIEVQDAALVCDAKRAHDSQRDLDRLRDR